MNETLHHGGHRGYRGSILITARFYLRALCVLCGGAVVVSSGGLLAQRPVSAIYGFTARSSAAERALERRFLAIPSPDQARQAHQFLTAEPHVAGSPRDRVLADWVRDRWRE